MKPICGQVNIPKVDNTNKCCEIIVSSDCTLINTDSSVLDIQLGDSLTKLIINLTNKLSQQDIKIYELEAGDGIVEEILSIEPDDFIFVEVGNEKKKIKKKNLFSVTPEPETYTLIVNSTPSDATVTLNGQVTKSITVPQGTNVTINVTKAGYVTHNSSVVVNANQTVPITLQAVPVQYTLTVTTNPSDSTILLNGQATNTLTVNAGTVINMVVSKAGYITQSEAITMNSNKTRNIILLQDLTPSFPYYWGEIGNIFAANPSSISEANWDTQIKPNGTNGGMSYFPNASSLPADMHKIATGLNYQWWIVLVPDNQNATVADLANYSWFIWDELLQAWVDYPSGGIQNQGTVTLDGILWRYTAVRPTTITRVKFSKTQISGQS